MAGELGKYTAATLFKAIDKYTNPVKAMTAVTGNFVQKARIGFAVADRQINKFNRSIGRAVGKIGQLAGGMTALMLVMTAGRAIVEVEDRMASLSAITGATGKQLAIFAKEVERVSTVEKKFAGDTAKAFELVGSAQPELLKSASALGKVTQATITLAKASGGELAQSAKDITGTMNQFGLRASQAARVMNVLAAGAKEGAASILETSESMDRVGAIAESSNLTLEQTVAALQLMSQFNLKGSEAGISLKTTLLRLKSASLGFASGQFNLNDALEEYNKKVSKIKSPIKKAAFEEEIFGKIHILTGNILTKNIGTFNRLTKAVTGTNEATKQAAINSDTVINRWRELVASFRNAVSTTDSNSKSLRILKNVLVSLADNMATILTLIGALIGAWIAWKVIVTASRIALTTYNIALGIHIALQNRQVRAFVIGRTAMIAYRTTLLLLRGPLGWVTLGVAALTAGLLLYINRSKTATEKAKEFGNTVNAQIFTETARLKGLFEQLSRTNPGSKRRIQLAKDMAVLHPDIIKSGSLINAGLAEQTLLLNQATAALRKNIVEKALSAEKEKILTAQFNAQKKAVDALFKVGLSEKQISSVKKLADENKNLSFSSKDLRKIIGNATDTGWDFNKAMQAAISLSKAGKIAIGGQIAGLERTGAIIAGTPTSPPQPVVTEQANILQLLQGQQAGGGRGRLGIDITAPSALGVQTEQDEGDLAFSFDVTTGG